MFTGLIQQGLLVIKLIIWKRTRARIYTGIITSLPPSPSVTDCRHAFAYAEKIEGYCRRMHNLSDVFQPELVSLRGK